jgi:hypothetical protein
MPLAQYLVWVGSALLALLFITDGFLPKPPADGKAEMQLPVIHISSDPSKWPERIVFDTGAPMPRPSTSTEVATLEPPAVAPVSASARAALAQLQTSDPSPPKKRLPRPQRLHKYARRTVKPVQLAARPSPFGWFGPTMW